MMKDMEKLISQQWNGYTLISKEEKKNKDGNIIIVLKSKPHKEKDANCINYVIFGRSGEQYGNILVKQSSDDLPNEVEIEYYAVNNPSTRNKGNISIGLNDVLNDIFTNFADIDKVYLNIAPSNIASQKVAQHCGFEKRADSRRYYEISKEKYLKENGAKTMKDETYAFTKFNDKEKKSFNNNSTTSIDSQKRDLLLLTKTSKKKIALIYRL